MPGVEPPAGAAGRAEGEVEVAGQPLAERGRGERHARVGDGQRRPQAAVGRAPVRALHALAQEGERGVGELVARVVLVGMRCLTVRPRGPLSLTSNAHAPLSTYSRERHL